MDQSLSDCHLTLPNTHYTHSGLGQMGEQAQHGALPQCSLQAPHRFKSCFYGVENKRANPRTKTLRVPTFFPKSSIAWGEFSLKELTKD